MLQCFSNSRRIKYRTCISGRYVCVILYFRDNKLYRTCSIFDASTKMRFLSRKCCVTQTNLSLLPTVFFQEFVVPETPYNTNISSANTCSIFYASTVRETLCNTNLPLTSALFLWFQKASTARKRCMLKKSCS